MGFSPGNCCSPSRCSWFSAMWLPLQGHAAFWGSVPAVALLSYLRQAADARHPSVPPKDFQQHHGISGASHGLCSRGFAGPSGQAILPWWPWCSFTKDSCIKSSQKCFQDFVASYSGLSGSPDEMILGIFALVKHIPLQYCPVA